MTIPSAYQRTTTGSGGTTVSSVAIGVTATTDLFGYAMPIKNQTVSGVRRIMEAKANTAGAYEARVAKSGAVFGYNLAASEVLSPLLGGNINGQTNLLKFTSADVGQNRKIVKPAGTQFGVKLVTAWAARTWNPMGISGQRVNWSSTPGTLTGTNYRLTTHASNAANDNAVGDITVTPKLTYMSGSTTPTNDTYPAFTGP